MAAHKTNLLKYLNRCNSVIDSEVGLLQQWAGDPRVDPGRQSQCNIYARMIGGDAGASINAAIDDANNLSDAAVLHSPDSQHIDLVANTEQSFASRSKWDGATLSDQKFTLALSTAKQNSDSAAQAGFLTLHDCTN
jgi:hypothetical protein